MSTFTDPNLVDELRKRLSFSILKPNSREGNTNSACVALSVGGARYWGGKVESDSNLLDVTAEQGALLMAAQYGDFGITSLVSLTEAVRPSVSPLTLKVLTDWSNRTGKPISYTLITPDGVIVFSIENVSTAIPWYIPTKYPPLTLPFEPYGPNFVTDTDHSSATLKEFTKKGLERAFHNYDGATAYGVAVRTKEGTTYFTSQYSSPDRRLGVHAEVAALVGAFMHGEKMITHLGIISPKFKTNPCAPCGSCRQFIGEFTKKLGWDLQISSFAYESDAILNFSVDELIPHLWAS